MAPVLFAGLPRKMFYLTAAAPFLCYWLFWGGTIWGPIVVAAGFAVAYFALRFASRSFGNLAGAIAGIVAPIVYWLFLAGPIIGALASVAPLAIQFVPSDDFGGFMLAFIIGMAGIILSLPLGVLLALGRQSHLFIINKVSVAFIEVIRGVPLIVWLFTASLLLNYFLPPGTNFDLMLRVIIMVTLFAAAYIAEVVRGGLAALPRGQYEGADSLGLDYWQSMQLIILPQALKISIPGIVNTFIGLFKDTTLVVFIGLLDPIGLTNAIRATTAWQGIYWELFIFIGILFFICCFSMSRYSIWLERKLQTDRR
jgi:general L-amino acid transport system permease protein